MQKFEKWIVEKFLMQGALFYDKVLLKVPLILCFFILAVIVFLGIFLPVRITIVILSVTVIGLLFLEILYTIADKYTEEDDIE